MPRLRGTVQDAKHEHQLQLARWRKLGLGTGVTLERPRHAREVSILAWGTYEGKRDELQRRIRTAIRRGAVRKAVRMTEELRQMVKARKAARRALRRAQLELLP